MKRMMAMTALLGLCACNSTESLTDRIAGSRVMGDETGVTVTQAASVADALPLAVGHCGHFHRGAQYAGRAGEGYRFRCVKS